MTIFKQVDIWHQPVRLKGIATVVEYAVNSSPGYYDEEIEALQAKIKTLTSIVGRISAKLGPEDQAELAALFHLEPEK